VLASLRSFAYLHTAECCPVVHIAMSVQATQFCHCCLTPVQIALQTLNSYHCYIDEM